MVIYDSNAVLIKGRILAQHQAVLSLLRQFTQDPKITHIKWLDLACGRGQILTNIENVISESGRKKIIYFGFDISKDYARETERKAKFLFFDAKVEICNLKYFEECLNKDDLFDIVTLTNSAHEITPESFGETIVAALCRTKSNGVFYLYDMVNLPEPELGSISWEGLEIQYIINEILKSVGVKDDSLPDVAVFEHKNCLCWNLQIHPNHLQLENLGRYKNEMIQKASKIIKEVLETKLFYTHSALLSASKYGPETVDEKRGLNNLLYDFWSLANFLGLPIELCLNGKMVKK